MKLSSDDLFGIIICIIVCTGMLCCTALAYHSIDINNKRNIIVNTSDI